MNPEAVIWRFLDVRKFYDLLETSELYFRRADLFPADEREGLPLEEQLLMLGLNPYDIWERQQLCNDLGSTAQFRESFYVNCWHLFQEETYQMWKDFGPQGFAICSRFSLLKAALNSLQDRAFLGLVRYGPVPPMRWNILRFITTKRIKYSKEREVRAILWIMDPSAGINRHIDEKGRAHSLPLNPPPEQVPTGQRRLVALDSLVTQVVLSPWADINPEDVNHVLATKGFSFCARHSELTKYRGLIPSPDDPVAGTLL